MAAVKLNTVNSSTPEYGRALNEPTIGGPFVVTRIEADDSPHDKVNISEELGGSMLLLMTRLTAEMDLAGIIDTTEDAAAVMRLNDVLLFTDHTDEHTTFVITCPLRTNVFCGFTYVIAWWLEVIDTVGTNVSAAVGTIVDE